MIELKIEKLIDKLIIVGKDVNPLEIEAKVTEVILSAINNAENNAEKSKKMEG